MKNSDQVKGRIKEAAGDLTDNKRLKREGKTDQAAGKAKKTVNDVVDSVKEKVHKATRDR